MNGSSGGHPGPVQPALVLACAVGAIGALAAGITPGSSAGTTLIHIGVLTLLIVIGAATLGLPCYLLHEVVRLEERAITGGENR